MLLLTPLIALHSFDCESAMLYHCAASFRLRISNVITYSSHCTVSFRQTIENLQCNISCNKSFRPTFNDVQHTLLIRVSLQQLRTTYYRLRTTDYGLRTSD